MADSVPQQVASKGCEGWAQTPLPGVFYLQPVSKTLKTPKAAYVPNALPYKHQALAIYQGF